MLVDHQDFHQADTQAAGSQDRAAQDRRVKPEIEIVERDDGDALCNASTGPSASMNIAALSKRRLLKGGAWQSWLG